MQFASAVCAFVVMTYLWSFPASARGAAAPLHEFDIAALPAALRLFSRTAGVQIVYPYDAFATLRSRRVKGRMIAEAALRAMIKGLAGAGHGDVVSRRRVERDAAAEAGAGSPERRSAPPGISGLKMLEQLPGFNVQTDGPLGLYEFGNSVQTRAFNLDQIGFTVDGIPLGRSDVFGGSPVYRYVDNENLAVVEAAPGAGTIDREHWKAKAVLALGDKASAQFKFVANDYSPFLARADYRSLRGVLQLHASDRIEIQGGRGFVTLGVKALAFDYRQRGHGDTDSYALPDGSSGFGIQDNSISYTDLFVPMAGVVLKASERTEIFADYVEDFAFPKGIDEIFAVPSPHPLAPPKPERARNIELGIRTSQPSWFASLELYSTRFDNRIQALPAPVPGVSGLLENYFRNVGGVAAHGFELAGTWKPASLGAIAYVNGSIAYNVARFRDDLPDSTSLAGKRIPDSAKWLISGGVTVEPTALAGSQCQRQICLAAFRQSNQQRVAPGLRAAQRLSRHRRRVCRAAAQKCASADQHQQSAQHESALLHFAIARRRGALPPARPAYRPTYPRSGVLDARFPAISDNARASSWRRAPCRLTSSTGSFRSPRCWSPALALALPRGSSASAGALSSSRRSSLCYRSSVATMAISPMLRSVLRSRRSSSLRCVRSTRMRGAARSISIF